MRPLAERLRAALLRLGRRSGARVMAQPIADLREPEIQAFDDVAHADRLLLAQALATAIGLHGQPRPLLGTQFLAFQGHRFHARLELVAAERGQQCEDGREDRDGNQHRDQEGRIREGFYDMFGHRKSACESKEPSTMPSESRLKLSGAIP